MTCACKTLSCCPPSDFAYDAQPVRLWYVGDFGTGDVTAQQVAYMATVADGDVIVTGGDNNYNTTYPLALAPYDTFQGWVRRGLVYPCPGNHDWDENDLGDYLDFFAGTIGNNRYYEKRMGPLHLFVLDSGWNSAGVLKEPDGNAVDSAQYAWFTAAVALSDAPWKVAVVHTPPYSSGVSHGSTPTWQWPFDLLGIDLVLSGHEHNYERLEHLGVTYIVNGCGGQTLYDEMDPLPQSVARITGYHGLSRLVVSPSKLMHEFWAYDGEIIHKWDPFTLTK